MNDTKRIFQNIFEIPNAKTEAQSSNAAHLAKANQMRREILAMQAEFKKNDDSVKASICRDIVKSLDMLIEDMQ